MLTFTILLTLCGMYCKFRTTAIGSRIIRVIPTAVILIIIPLVVMAMFIVSAGPSGGFGSLSAWLTNTTVITAVNVLMIVAVGIYVHFPANLFEQCRCPYLSTKQSKQQNELHPPELNNSTKTRFSNPHSTITTETTPLITHASKTGQHNDPSHTTISIAHSPVTTVTAPLVSKSAPSQ